MLYSPFLHHFDLHIPVRLYQRLVPNAEIRPNAYLHKIANIPIDQIISTCIQCTICATPSTTCGRKMPARKFRIRRYSAWHYRAGGCTPKVAHKLEDQHFNDCSCHTQCSLQSKCRDIIKQWVQGNKNRYRV